MLHQLNCTENKENNRAHKTNLNPANINLSLECQTRDSQMSENKNESSRLKLESNLKSNTVETQSNLIRAPNGIKFGNDEKFDLQMVCEQNVATPNSSNLSSSSSQLSSKSSSSSSSSLNVDADDQYTKRTRSLVEDAKFDTVRNRELAEERRWLVERIQSKDGSIDDCTIEQLNKSKELLAGLTEVDFPRHISQLDQCNHLLIKYEPELDPTHPGFHDPEYRERRKEVAQIAFAYKYGQPIPEVKYNEKEIQTWRFIYTRLKEAYASYACKQHNMAIEQLERECGYSPDSIPQLQRVSEFLERKTGWRLRPAAGLLSARDFLASLAFRVFQTTQYIRHWGNPEHSVEPDCIHELMGHIPMLCDPSFAQFSQELGLASLGASDEQIEKFATLYWFTVEFGLCREDGQLKCYGAGLLSSYGEMEHALESNKPALKEFVPEETAAESYDDADYQVSYYVAQSFDDAKLKIKQYANKHLNRDFELAYDPYSCSVRVLDSLDRLDSYAEQIKNDVMRLSSAIGKIRLSQQQGRKHEERSGQLRQLHGHDRATNDCGH